MSTIHQGEKSHLFSRISSIANLNDIYILDRGYGHYNTIVNLTERDKQYCIRLSSGSSFFKKAMASDETDYITDWHPSEKEKENARKDKIRYHPIKVRITKIKLKSGETELLVSSLLDMKKYRTQDLKWLYQKRWVVEEGFKKLKPKMKLEYFGCRKSQGVYQEYYAHIFIMNIIAFLRLMSREKVKNKTKHRQYSYKSNWQNAYRTVRLNILELLTRCKITSLIEQLIVQIARSIIPYIPDKCSERDMRQRNKRGRISPYYK